MNRREGSVVEVSEAFKEVEIILIGERGRGTQRTRSAERPANRLSGETRARCCRSGVKRNVGNRAVLRQLRDSVYGEAANRHGRFVDVRKQIIEATPDAYMRERCILEIARNASVEYTEARTRGDKRGAEYSVTRREKRLLCGRRALCPHRARGNRRRDAHKAQ